MLPLKMNQLLILAREFSVIDVLSYNPITNQLRIIRAEHFVVPVTDGRFA